MEIREGIALKYWLLAAEEEMATTLREQGFEVLTTTKMDDLPADLVAKKAQDLLVVEFKSTLWDQDRVRQAQELRNLVVHKYGGRFHLLWVSPPKELEIEVDELEDILSEYLSENIQPELDEMSSSTYIEGISDVEVESVHLRKGCAEIAGNASVDVELNWGSGSTAPDGDAYSSNESVPLHFNFTLDSDLKIVGEPSLVYDID